MSDRFRLWQNNLWKDLLCKILHGGDDPHYRIFSTKHIGPICLPPQIGLRALKTLSVLSTTAERLLLDKEEAC